MAYRRRTKKGDLPEQMEPEQPTRTHELKTDQLFEEYRPGYYEFDDKTYNRTCVLCGEKFQTTLGLLRFCSPDCQKDVMIAVAKGLKK